MSHTVSKEVRLNLYKEINEKSSHSQFENHQLMVNKGIYTFTISVKLHPQRYKLFISLYLCKVNYKRCDHVLKELSLRSVVQPNTNNPFVIIRVRPGK